MKFRVWSLNYFEMSQYWPLLDELPKELKEKIEQLVWDMEHKEKFLPVVKGLPLKSIQHKLNILFQEYIAKYEYDSFIAFLKDKLNDKEKIVEVLSNCKCCQRHQKNKPKHINDWKLNFRPKEEPKKIICYCNCRQYSRMICSSVLI